MQTIIANRQITNTITIVADTFARNNVAAFQAYHNEQRDTNAFRGDSTGI